MALRARAFFCFSLREQHLFPGLAANADERRFRSREIYRVRKRIASSLSTDDVRFHWMAGQLLSWPEETEGMVEAAVADLLVVFFVYQVTGWPGDDGFG